MNASIKPFGTTAAGAAVQVITLRAGELTARVLTYGATLQDLRLAGTPWPLCLGAERVAAYEARLPWCGAVVGPVANRIGGATALVAGELWAMEANDGANTLHSGSEGVSQQIWQIEAAKADEVTLLCALPHGACGLPGTREIRAHYRLVAPATLEITLTARSDAPTLMNLAHHPYWNLDGTPSTAGHRLSIAAAQYLPTDTQNLPLAPVPVAGTGFDLSAPRALPDLPPLDHNFCLAGEGLREVARLSGAKGVSMAVETDAPGLQVYDGRALASTPWPGLTGAPYGAHAGLAMEPQLWPDAPAHGDFPPINLAPGTEWRQVSRLHFTREEAK